jgi:hypothetical protein
MDRRTFLKGSVGGLALIAMAKSAPLAEASTGSPPPPPPMDRSFRLVPIQNAPSPVMAVAERFSATGHYGGDVGDLPLEWRPMVLTYHSGMGNTGWVFFMGPEKYWEDIELVVTVIVPDKGSQWPWKFCYQLARDLGYPLTVCKDGTVIADFTEKAWEYVDQAVSGYCLGFIY